MILRSSWKGQWLFQSSLADCYYYYHYFGCEIYELENSVTNFSYNFCLEKTNMEGCGNKG